MKKLLQFAGVTALCLVALTVGKAVHTSALSSRLPDTSDAAFGVSNYRDRFMIVATGDLKSPDAYGYAYVPVGQGSFSITVTQACHDHIGNIYPSPYYYQDGGVAYASYFEIMGIPATYTSNDGNGDGIADLSCASNLTLSGSTAGAYVVTTAIGSFYELRFHAHNTTVDRPGGINFFSENSFQVSVNNSGGWMGYAGDLYSVYGSQFAITNVNGPSNNSTISVGLEFGLACNTGPVSSSIQVFDDDYGQPFQTSAITWGLYSRPRASSGGEGYGTYEGGGSLTAGADGTVTLPVTLYDSKDYFIRFDNIWRQNGVQFKLPYKQIEAYTPDCATEVAACVGAYVNTPTIFPSTVFSVTIQLQNIGNTTWTPGLYNLGSSYGRTNNFATNGGGDIRAGSVGGNVGPGGVATFTFNWTAPSSPGTYPFQWMMVHEGVAWFGAACGPNVTVIPRVDAATCTNASIVNVPGYSYPNSRYTMSITVRNDGNYTWIPGQWNLGSAYGQTNNYVTDGGGEIRASWPNGNWVGPGGSVTFTYTATLPGYGGTYASNWRMVHEGVQWFGFTNGYQCGFNFTVAQGRMGDAFNWNNVEAGTIETCSMGQVHTGTSGFFTFVVPQGWGYCVRATRDGAAPDNYWVRPWSEGYIECPGTNGSTPADQGYCTTRATYECQVAGNVISSAACGIAGVDRQLDYGFDIALGWRPVVTCSFSSSIPGEAGVAYTPAMVLTRSSPGAGASPGSISWVSRAFTYTVNSTPAKTAQNPNAGSLTGNGSTPPISLTYPTTPLVVDNPGDYTETITGNITSGPYTIAPGGCTKTTHTSFRPYFKAYGTDIRAGGNFAATGGACATASSGGVYGIAGTDGAGKYRGASAQFGIMALLQVNGVYSTSQRQVADVPPAGATFANLQPPVTNSDTTYGGGYGVGACMTNYYGDPSGYPATSNVSTALGQTEKNLRTAAGDITPGTGTTITVPKGRQLVLYATGDVYIDDNIAYSTDARATTDDVPFFTLVVKGNIYISPSVSRLDGLYIAQPATPGNTATDGRIYTCAPSAGNLYTPGQLMSSCNGQLVVNGGLIAQQVKFLRTFKSLKDSSNAEAPDFSNGTATNAAEVINFSPEMYIAPSPLKDPNATITSSPYDAIFSLPPVF